MIVPGVRRLTEGRSKGKVFGPSDVEFLRIPDGTVGAVELCDILLDGLVSQFLCVDT